MKKVIGGKLYNTDTAELVGEWSNGHFRSDFHYCSEDLYRTKKGSWFIHGEGGALSKYAESHGNNRTNGEAIEVVTQDEALEWCERHLNPDEYAEHFPGMIEEG